MSETLNVADHTCRAIINRVPGIPIVFLHGYSFTSDVWEKTGATELLRLK